MVAASKQLERVGMNRVEGVPISSAVVSGGCRERDAEAQFSPRTTDVVRYSAVTSTPFMHDCKKHEVSNSNAIFSLPKV